MIEFFKKLLGYRIENVNLQNLENDSSTITSVSNNLKSIELNLEEPRKQPIETEKGGCNCEFCGILCFGLDCAICY